MVTSADVAILFHVAELAKRCGLRPSDADGTVHYETGDNDPKGEEYFSLSFSGEPTDPVKYEKFQKFKALLGMKGCFLKVDELSDLEDAVERALALAPQSRTR